MPTGSLSIPEPQGVSKLSCTSAQMCITLARYKAATKHLRRLASEMLDLKLPSKRQNPANWKNFLCRLCEADAIFLDYEHFWPVHRYYNRWIMERTCNSRHPGLRDTNSKRMEGPTLIGTQRNPGTQATQSNEANAHHRYDSSGRPNTKSGSIRRNTKSSTDFRNLLQALNPKIDDLLSIFERNGVRDEDDLRTVAVFPPSTLGLFFREDMGLNPFQVRKVTLALESLKGGPR
ncbi:hypothetical protein BDY19DRAFT_492730 [Irpex rosettiformis]|uniref:Uncharacterized protein n=1 Tax=Irpex rosettiformis TaxID=378272 RepID=A0ACB8UE42_9APHY|nr:hypothetical protein BDY19DRAFT_492730 [Irpex rosettiformis]